MRIKEIMKEKGVTQAGLADALGITQASVSAAINGDCRISTLQKIAKALNVNIQDLFDLPDIEAESQKWYEFNFRMDYLAHKDEYEKTFGENFRDNFRKYLEENKQAAQIPNNKTSSGGAALFICPHCGKEIPLKIDTEALSGKR